MTATTTTAASPRAGELQTTPQDSSTTNEQVSLSSFTQVRAWLQHNHRKQLNLLDRFLLELRHENNNQDRRVLTHRTVDLLRHLIGSTKWKSPAQLLQLLRGIGCELQAAGGAREPAIGNVVRRIMAAVREEALRMEEQKSMTLDDKQQLSSMTPRLTLQSMLWALPQHVRKSSRGSGDANQRQESFGNADVESEYPPSYYTEPGNSDLKSSIMEASKYYKESSLVYCLCSMNNNSQQFCCLDEETSALCRDLIVLDCLLA
jgi:hypothetical protein